MLHDESFLCFVWLTANRVYARWTAMKHEKNAKHQSQSWYCDWIMWEEVLAPTNSTSCGLNKPEASIKIQPQQQQNIVPYLGSDSRREISEHICQGCRLSLVWDVLRIWTAFKIYVNIRSFVVLPQQGMYKWKQTRTTSWRCYALGERLLRLKNCTQLIHPYCAVRGCARLWPC